MTSGEAKTLEVNLLNQVSDLNKNVNELTVATREHTLEFKAYKELSAVKDKNSEDRMYGMLNTFKDEMKKVGDVAYDAQRRVTVIENARAVEAAEMKVIKMAIKWVWAAGCAVATGLLGLAVFVLNYFLGK